MDDVQQLQATANGFRWTDADAYIFDIDGTLLNVRDLVHWNALHQAMLEVYGVDTSIEGIAYHGKTDLGILRATLERVNIAHKVFEEKLPQALAVICREVDRHSDKIVPEVCPCIPDLLRTLQRTGKVLGVASGNLKTVGWHKVKAAGLEHFFQFGCFSDDCEPRVGIFRQAVAVVRDQLGAEGLICFIGDTPSDIQAALELKAKVIAVSTGVFSRDELSAHGPHICVGSCQELLYGD